MHNINIHICMRMRKFIYAELLALPCRHTFHAECCKKWLLDSKKSWYAHAHVENVFKKYMTCTTNNMPLIRILIL